MGENNWTSARLGHVLRLPSTGVSSTVPAPSESSVMLCGMRAVNVGVNLLDYGDVLHK